MWQHSNIRDGNELIMNALRSVGISCLLYLFSMAATAAEPSYAWAPALEIGEVLPQFELADQSGRLYAAEDLPGDTGMMLFFNRSTDW